MIDIVVAVAALVVTSPLLCITAAMVWIDSRGNPFYLAERVGKDGKAFRMWKFRTMIPGAAMYGSVTGHNDPRITRLGRFLRKSKVDELPQFINVLLGDMTLVGPRPETPDMVALYTPAQRLVLAVRPGLTGHVQLGGEESEFIPEGASPTDFYVSHLLESKVNTDLEYLRTRTASSDTRIVFQTALFVLRSLVRQ